MYTCIYIYNFYQLYIYILIIIVIIFYKFLTHHTLACCAHRSVWANRRNVMRSKWGRGGGGQARGQNTVCWSCHYWPGSGIGTGCLLHLHVIRSAIWIRLQIQSEVWHYFCSKCVNYQTSVFTDNNSVFHNSRWPTTIQLQVQQKWTMFSPTASHAGWPCVFVF